MRGEIEKVLSNSLFISIYTLTTVQLPWSVFKGPIFFRKINRLIEHWFHSFTAMAYHTFHCLLISLTPPQTWFHMPSILSVPSLTQKNKKHRKKITPWIPCQANHREVSYAQTQNNKQYNHHYIKVSKYFLSASFYDNLSSYFFHAEILHVSSSPAINNSYSAIADKPILAFIQWYLIFISTLLSFGLQIACSKSAYYYHKADQMLQAYFEYNWLYRRYHLLDCTSDCLSSFQLLVSHIRACSQE